MFPGLKSAALSIVIQGWLVMEQKERLKRKIRLLASYEEEQRVRDQLNRCKRLKNYVKLLRSSW
jgi:hypothetical protein